MTTFKVPKKCSILTYIEEEDKELYSLIHGLCLFRIFSPQSKTQAGLTFLRPDAGLLNKLKDLIGNSQYEDAVSKIQSLSLLAPLPTLESFKSSDIPTFLGKKLAVKSATSTSVELSNGAKITADPKFEPRTDSHMRLSLQVYKLSGDFVVAEGESKFPKGVPKNKDSVKGGAQIEGLSRSQLFEKVLNTQFDKSRDSAMELLSCMHKYFTNTNKEEVAEVIKSQCSYDTLSSLACVLQPYKTSGSFYINDENLTSFTKDVGMEDAYKNDIESFSHNTEVSTYFDELAGQESEVYQTIKTKVLDIAPFISSGTTENTFLKAINACKQYLPGARSAVSQCEIAAEAELRAATAIILEYGADESNALLLHFKTYTLDKPVVCFDSAKLTDSTKLVLYYSTAYLAMHSDALLYTPGTEGESLSALVSGNNPYISINKVFRSLHQHLRNASQKAINAAAARSAKQY